MSCDTYSASSAVSRETLVNTLAQNNLLHAPGLSPSLSGRSSPAIGSGIESGLGLGLQESGKLCSFNSDASSGDHVRITMKTRVAVRDTKSHRFQVVPLRDITKDALSRTELESGRLVVPTTPVSYLRTPSSKKFMTSHTKTMTSSPSVRPLCSIYGKENRHSEAGTEANVKALDSFEIKTSVSSETPSAERNAMLSEVELNVVDIKSSSLPQLSSNRTNPASPAVISNFSSQKSLNNSFSSTSTHTISQSLYISGRYKTHASKFSSLGYLSLDPDSGREGADEEDKEAPVFDSANPRSEKRHALRTPPLFLPYFDRLASSGPVNPDPQQVLHEAISDQKSELVQGAASDIVQADNDRTICPEFRLLDAYLDDQAVPCRILEDPFSVSSSGSIEFAPIDSPLHHSSPKSGNWASRIRHGAACQTSRRVQRGDRRIVYPKIVLDLFVELDKAIESWSAKNM
ncbi:hypothetical protein JR316_0004973 [Psilocybe cubensis]|uniref:Uncharacterized protein n=2 Tax=Psilocybe cubensis TaxID=181762 RepID=A0ACB8H4N3_PSICU|nr:hypothetical protein JR316_0004973 [Psilocybe cubensis]KAH9482873.1 hypothetical protein JR316_0004973 [Psilocybe cubensis]